MALHDFKNPRWFNQLLGAHFYNFTYLLQYIFDHEEIKMPLWMLQLEKVETSTWVLRRFVRFRGENALLNEPLTQRIFWGADTWIFEERYWDFWNYFRDNNLFALPRNYRQQLELDLRHPKALLNDEEDLRDILEISNIVPWYIRIQRMPRVFPISEPELILNQPYPSFIQAIIASTKEGFLGSYFQLRRIKERNRFVKRGEYNLFIRTFDLYPTFDLPSDIKKQIDFTKFKIRPVKRDSLFVENDDFYYTMLLFGRHTSRYKMQVRDLLHYAFIQYNRHNRVILKNEANFFNFPPTEYLRRLLKLPTFLRVFFYTESYVIAYGFLYIIWQRYYRTIFLFATNPILLTLRNIALIALTLDWFLAQQYMGDDEWKGHKEAQEPIDYAYEEHIWPIDQIYTYSLDLHNDEVAGREFTDIQQNQSRYILFEPDLQPQSAEYAKYVQPLPALDRVRLARNNLSETLEHHWWQQVFGQTWWWWGVPRVALIGPLKKITKFVRRLWIVNWWYKLPYFSYSLQHKIFDILQKREHENSAFRKEIMPPPFTEADLYTERFILWTIDKYVADIMSESDKQEQKSREENLLAEKKLMRKQARRNFWRYIIPYLIFRIKSDLRPWYNRLKITCFSSFVRLIGRALLGLLPKHKEHKD